MPKIDSETFIPSKIGNEYPSPYDREPSGRVIRDLSAAVGAMDWIANHVIVLLAAGHRNDTGMQAKTRWWSSSQMRTGDIAIYCAGDGNCLHLVNESGAPFIILALSRPERSLVAYRHIDWLCSHDTGDTHRDGTPF